MITPATGRRVRIPIRSRCGEPTIAEMLSDSIVRAVMRADRVDPATLEAELRHLAKAPDAPSVIPRRLGPPRGAAGRQSG